MILDPQGKPLAEPRTRSSADCEVFECGCAVVNAARPAWVQWCELHYREWWNCHSTAFNDYRSTK